MYTYELVIIGGGPAALSAAFYALEKEINVLLIGDEMGGKTAWQHTVKGIEEHHYLPSIEIVETLLKRINTHPARVLHDRVVKVEQIDAGLRITTRQHDTINTLAALVATGTTPRQLNIPGVQRLGGHGLGYSITTFAQLVVAQRVAVVGITPRTLRGVAELANTAGHIYLIGRGDEYMGVPLIDVLQQQPNITLLLNSSIKALVGDTTVEGMVIEHGGQTRHIEIDRVFVDLGLSPNTDMVRDLDCTDRDGFIVVDEYNTTTVRGLFAAGDVTNSSFGEQILIAVGDGARAAVSAYTYLLTQRLARTQA